MILPKFSPWLTPPILHILFGNESVRAIFAPYRRLINVSTVQARVRSRTRDSRPLRPRPHGAHLSPLRRSPELCEPDPSGRRRALKCIIMASFVGMRAAATTPVSSVRAPAGRRSTVSASAIRDKVSAISSFFPS